MFVARVDRKSTSAAGTDDDSHSYGGTEGDGVGQRFQASEGPRSPTSEKEIQLFYEEQERQDTQRRLSRRSSRTKSWRRSLIGRPPTSKIVNATPAPHDKATSEADSDAYGTGKYFLVMKSSWLIGLAVREEEDSSNPRSPSPTYADPVPGPSSFRPSPTTTTTPASAPPTPGWAPGPGVGVFANAHRKPVPGRASTLTSPTGSQMSLPTPAPPAHYVRDQSHIPWHQRRYEIYQPPAIGARAPPRYYNYHLLSAHARERLERANTQGLAGRVPMIPSLNGSMFSGVGSGMGMGNSARSSLAGRRPSLLGALSPTGGSAGIAGLETITASPASTAAPLNSPSLDLTNALNSGPAASHRLSTLLKRPPASPHTFSQPLPTDATDLMDGTDPFGSMWHHSSPYDAGEIVVSRGFGRGKDTGSPDAATPHSRPSMLSPIATTSSVPKKGPSPLSQSTSAINLTDPEPPLPEPPGSPDLLSSSRVKRKLSKRRSSGGNGRSGFSALFGRKQSVDDEGGDGRGLRGRSRPPLSPSSLSLAQSQSQGITFPSSPVDGEKRTRRKLSKRGRSRSTSSAASVDSGMQSIETPIHGQFSQVLGGAGRDVVIEELPSVRQEQPRARQLPQQPQQHARTSSQPSQPQYARSPSQHHVQPPSQQHARPPSQQHQTSYEPPMTAPPTTHAMPIPSTPTPVPASAPPVPKPSRERKISAASINSFLSRITSRDKDKDRDRDEKHPPRAASAQETDRKIAPHMLLNHVGPGGKRNKSGVFGRLARKLSLIRRRSVDVIGTNGQAEADARLDAALRPLNGRPSFQVERPRKDTGRSSSGVQPMLQRRATLDLGAGPGAGVAQQFPRVSPEPLAQGYGQAQLYSQHTNGTVAGTEELFAPIDPQLRSSQLIKTAFSPPPRIPDLAIAANRESWASLHRHVSNARPPKSEVGAAEEVRPNPTTSASTSALAATLAKGKSNPSLVTEDLLPPPALNDNRHPDSPHSIPKWGIANGAPQGPGLIMNGSPTDDSPLSLPRTRLTVANPDMIDSEAESTSPGKSAEAAERRNRALPPNPPMSPPPVPVPMQELVTKRESVKPLVVKKDRSRTPSPVKPNLSMSGRESPTKKSGRESPTKRSGKERGREREPRREHSPVKRRTEPLKDHSAMNGDSQKPRVPFEALRNGEAEMGSPGASLRTSMMANGSTTSVDAIQGDDDVEFGVKEKDSNGRVLRRSRASMDSIGKIHVITPKTSLQKIRVRVVSNPAPIEVTKETSPVKEDAPDLVSSPESMDVSVTADSRSSSLGEPIAQPTRSKSRPRSGYTGGESKHSIYGTASNVSVDDYSEDAGSPRSSVMGPRPRIPIAEFETPLAPPVIPARTGSRASPHMTPDMRAQMQPKLAESSAVTPYMTPTDEHGPLHPFSEKPIEYRNLMPSIAPISVMRVEAAMPPLKGDALSKLRASPENLKGAFMDPLFDLPPPKAPFMNEAFSVSKEKLAAQSEFKKASQSHKRESTTESERDRRRAKEEREEERVRARERAERVERHERDRAERAERERLDRERLERERAERERAELERIELERAERERVQRAEKERLDRERVEWERAVERARAEQARVEQARAEQERLEWERAEEQQRLERERLRAEKEQVDRERQERHRLAQLKKEQDREREREQQRLKDSERQAREREFERLEMERLERERLEREQERIDRERLERIRAEQERLEWERQEYERLERERLEEELRQRERLEEELRQRERENSQPPPLIHSRQSSGGGSRRRHDYDGEREVHVVTMKEARKASKRRGTPGQSRSTSPTSTVPPPPPPKDDRMFKTRQRSRTDTSTHNIPHTVSPPPIEVLGGVPVLPQGTHIEVAPTYARASSEEATDLSTLKAREAWERERLDKGQSVLGPGVQRAVIPDPSSPRPTPDPRQRPPTSNGRSLTTPNPIGHTESYILPPVQIHPSASANMLPSEYGPTHASYAQPSYPQPIPAPRSHNPLPKPPTISGPVPLHSRPGPAYTNPNRQRPSATRNPLPVPPRVSPYPMHHNVSPPRGHPPGAVDARAPGRWETMPS